MWGTMVVVWVMGPMVMGPMVWVVGSYGLAGGFLSCGLSFWASLNNYIFFDVWFTYCA